MCNVLHRLITRNQHDGPDVSAAAVLPVDYRDPPAIDIQDFSPAAVRYVRHDARRQDCADFASGDAPLLEPGDGVRRVNDRLVRHRL